MYLDKIDSPADLRALDHGQLDVLCEEIRQFIVESVSRTGGHLGSNLGAVELTIALHRVFESPRDLIVWDTGHQAYAHKIVTGRREAFSGLRQRDGLSGYPSRDESPHDVVENSHASTSLSWAHGLAGGLALRHVEHRSVVAVIGDGAMTGGMAFEALNNLGHSGRRAVIVLNDNGRSYAPTVSRLSTALSQVRVSPAFVKNRDRLYELLRRVPMGTEFKRGLEGAKAAVREMWEPPAFFETLGVRYTGPFDGHDLPSLEQALRHAATYDGPIVVHVMTEKGHGYRPAEEHRESHLHDTGLFDPAVGPTAASPQTAEAAEFKAAFVETLLDLGASDERVVAITAAMPGSTGVLRFQERFGARAVDVGIAEQHAVTMAAGMATAGLRPVVAVYATFLTRAMDQVMYDVGLHRLPVVFCLDRAGITGPDGPSHHGVYDLALLLRVPGITILCPSSYQEVDPMLRAAIAHEDGPVALRWPKGAAPQVAPDQVGSGFRARRVLGGDGTVALLALGRLVPAAVEAAALLAEQGVDATVWDMRAAKPLDDRMLRDAAGHRVVITVEEGVRAGGVGQSVAGEIWARQEAPPVITMGTPDEYLPHGNPTDLLAEYGLDAAGIAGAAVKAVRDLT